MERVPAALSDQRNTEVKNVFEKKNEKGGKKKGGKKGEKKGAEHISHVKGHKYAQRGTIFHSACFQTKLSIHSFPTL